ncbi:jacalin-related lectin 3-like [Ananas comosus]|uniref:Jacalin-related lectin 3-like n=1 Tax=Ananas comosus TaxID=4615 RepID=A0A6P5EV07_ANACO|nr:jacalin-related lectin 3-like [Ananas comosus]
MNIGQTGETFIRIGPQGDDRGDEWDDGCFDGVREILIWHGDKINAIQFVDDRDGTSVLSDKHGGNGTNFDHIQLNYPSEYLTEINGFWGDSYYLPSVIESLKFSSNRRSFGPFGRSEPSKRPASMYDSRESAVNHFHFKVMDNKLCGFFGRSDANYLYAIGIHFRALQKTALKFPRPASAPPNSSTVVTNVSTGNPNAVPRPCATSPSSSTTGTFASAVP